MSKTNLLNTSTINYMELIGNGRAYKVPPYQRDYSWEEEHWEDLWNDILELRSRPEERHYMGALVVEGRSDREFLIIDGQQRMATLSVIALAIIKRLKDLSERGIDPEPNTQRASELRNRFIGEKDPASLVESSKLFLNETDNAFYQDYLVQLKAPLNPRGLPKSNRLLWECFRYFSEKLDNILEIQQNGEGFARILSEHIARQLLFILITVDDELNAYTVFETLNARGLALTTTDLLKNYLFSRVRVAADLEVLHRRWRALIATVGQERFPEFLRYHILCELPKVRSQRLFKIVRDRAKTPDNVFQLLDELESRAELFSALSDPNHGYWSDSTDAKPFIRELNLFRVRQMTPLLFAAYQVFSREDFIRILKLICIISFRYTIVSGLNTNPLELVYHHAAKSVLENTARFPREVFEKLKPIYVDDGKFKQDFAQLTIDTGGQRKKLAKYILARLEQEESKRACDPDTDPATIEHILPENPMEVWSSSFPRDRWDASVYRLGNLTLLDSSANRSVGNSEYDQKRGAYEKSQYTITKNIPVLAPDQWTSELLDERQRRFAEQAVHIWRADFV